MNRRIAECEGLLKDLGPQLPVSNQDKVHFLWKIVHEFVLLFRNSITGTYEKSSLSKQKESYIPAGSKVRMILNEMYRIWWAGNKRATSDYTDDHIKRAIILHEGDSIPGFPSIDAFLYLLQPQLEKFKEPAMEAIQEIYMILEETSTKILEKLLRKVPSMQETFNEYVSRVIQNVGRILG